MGCFALDRNDHLEAILPISLMPSWQYKIFNLYQMGISWHNINFSDAQILFSNIFFWLIFQCQVYSVLSSFLDILSGWSYELLILMDVKLMELREWFNHVSIQLFY